MELSSSCSPWKAEKVPQGAQEPAEKGRKASGLENLPSWSRKCAGWKA